MQTFRHFCKVVVTANNSCYWCPVSPVVFQLQDIAHKYICAEIAVFFGIQKMHKMYCMYSLLFRLLILWDNLNNSSSMTSNTINPKKHLEQYNALCVFSVSIKKVYNVQLVCNQFTTFFIDKAIICWWGSSFLFGCTLNALYCIYICVYARQNKLRILQNYCKSYCRHLMKIFMFEYLRTL